MTRQHRFDPPGGWHHVMHRGNRRQAIFTTAEDRFQFLARLAQMVETTDIEIHAFALMDNHYHLLVHCPTGGLSEGIRRVNAAYAQGYNHTHSIDGHLFRGRFRSLIVESDAYLVEVLRYIHRNPVEAGLSLSAGDYQWSSHRTYVTGARHPRWLSTYSLLRYFQGNRNRLDQFVEAPDTARARRVLDAIDDQHPAIGDDDFIARLLREFPPSSETLSSANRVAPVSQPVDFAAIEAAIGSSSDTSLAGWKPEQADRPVWFGALLAVLHREFFVDQAELAERYGYRSRTSVSSAVKRFEARAKESIELRVLHQRISRTARAALPEAADNADATPRATHLQAADNEAADNADATPRATQGRAA